MMKTEKTCETCKHFQQHYIKWGKNRYTECGFGHCVYPRCKPRYINTKACQHYTPKKEG